MLRRLSRLMALELLLRFDVCDLVFRELVLSHNTIDLVSDNQLAVGVFLASSSNQVLGFEGDACGSAELMSLAAPWHPGKVAARCFAQQNY